MLALALTSIFWLAQPVKPCSPEGRSFLGSPPPTAKSFFFKISDFLELRFRTSVSSLEQTRAPQNRHGPDPGRLFTIFREEIAQNS